MDLEGPAPPSAGRIAKPKSSELSMTAGLTASTKAEAVAMEAIMNVESFIIFKYTWDLVESKDESWQRKGPRKFSSGESFSN